MNRRHRLWRPERLLDSCRRLAASNEGATAMEYALIASLVAVGLIGALGGLGQAIRDLPMTTLMNAFASVLS